MIDIFDREFLFVSVTRSDVNHQNLWLTENSQFFDQSVISNLIGRNQIKPQPNDFEQGLMIMLISSRPQHGSMLIQN
jgi:hypothetical protein